MANGLTLFQRDDCYLCDAALALLARACAPEFASVFIDGDAVLEARYGARVPVLRDEGSGAELDWPFAQDALQEMLKGAQTPDAARTDIAGHRTFPCPVNR